MNWLLMAILTSILWGLCYASTEQIVKYINIKTYLAISCFFCFWGYAILSYLEPSQENFKDNLLKASPWIIISIFASFFGSYCSTYAIKHGGASLSAIIEISYPVWVVLFSSAFSGQNNFNINILYGGIMIFIGTVLVIRS